MAPKTDWCSNFPGTLSTQSLYCFFGSKIPVFGLLLGRIAKAGGVIGIGYWADVICDPSPDGVAKAIRAAVDLLGEDHVSLGSDFDGAVSVHFDVSELAALTQALINIGLSEEQIVKIMGGNLLRVMRDTLPEG